MRKKNSPVRILSLLLGASAALIGLVGAWRTFNVQGEQAVQAMSVDEREYLKRLRRLDAGMSRSEVESVLGPADHWTGLGADEQGTWSEVPGAPLSRVTVHIDQGEAQRARWMKIGYFTYEVPLRSR